MEHSLKKLIGNIIKKVVKVRKSNLRKNHRQSNNQNKPQYVSLIDNSNNRIEGKLLDVSNDGCKIIFTNIRLFINSEYKLDLSDCKRIFHGNIIWSEHFKLDFSRYCVVGIKFL
jgi:hypothetical protein